MDILVSLCFLIPLFVGIIMQTVFHANHDANNDLHHGLFHCFILKTFTHGQQGYLDLFYFFVVLTVVC